MIIFNTTRNDANQRGINMVDLMMWLVIAALLLAAALQSIGYYQKAALVYQAKSDVMGVFTWASATSSMDGGKTPTETHLITALNAGDLKMSKANGETNTAIISSAAAAGQKTCVGVRAVNIQPPMNVFYISSDDPSKVVQSNGLPSGCGDYNETTMQSGSGSYSATNNIVYNANLTTLNGIVSFPGSDPARFSTQHVKTGGPTPEIPAYVHNTWTVGLTADKNFWAGITNGNSQMRPLTAGKTYDESVWVRTSKDLLVHTDALVQNVDGVTVLDTPNVNVLVKANTWTQLTTSWTAPADAYDAKIRAVLGGNQLVEVGSTIDVTGFSLTERK